MRHYIHQLSFCHNNVTVDNTFPPCCGGSSGWDTKQMKYRYGYRVQMYVCTYKKLLRDFKLGFAATICTYIYVCIYVHMYVSTLVTKSKSMSSGL